MPRKTPVILVVLCHTHNIPFFGMLGDMLTRRGARVRYLSTDGSIERRARARHISAPNVMHTRLAKDAPRPEVDLDDVCRYVLANPYLKPDSARLLTQAENVARAYAQHFDRVNPDLVMAWNGTYPAAAAAMRLAESRAIRALYFEQGCFPGTVICDPRGVNYEGMMRDAVLPETFDRARIGAWLEAFRGRRRVPAKPGAQAGALAEALVDAAANFFARRSPFHPTLYFDHDIAVHPSRYAARVMRYLRALFARRASAQAEEQALPERFIFLPLQVHDDTQVVVHSPRIRTMEALVERTIAALPDGWALVVKSHPADEGRRDYARIAAMCARARCMFLHRADTVTLIRRAGCVVTLNSTVGLEALAWERPVVTLGDAVYAGRGITVDVTNLSEYPQRLAEAVAFVPDAADVRRFLDFFIFEYSKPGNFRRPVEAELRPLVDYVASQLPAAKGLA